MIAITGGAGFIGANLAKELSKDHPVFIADNFTLGRTENIHDKCLAFNSIDSLPWKEIKAVYHFGNYSSAPMYHTNTENRMTITISEFIYLCERCIEHDIRLIFASTSSIQGPRTFYSSCREIYETLASAYKNERGLDYVGFRFFSVYGPGESHKGKYANCITQFLWAMQKGERPVIYGDGTQSRDFVYVSDVVACLKNAFKADLKHPVYEVGLGSAHSFNEVVELLNVSLGTQIQPMYVNNPIKNYVRSTISTEFYNTICDLQWQPKINLSDGIKLLTEHY